MQSICYDAGYAPFSRTRRIWVPKKNEKKCFNLFSHSYICSRSPHRYVRVALIYHCRPDNSNDSLWFLFLIWSLTDHFDALNELHVLNLTASNRVEPTLKFIFFAYFRCHWNCLSHTFHAAQMEETLRAFFAKRVPI